MEERDVSTPPCQVMHPSGRYIKRAMRIQIWRKKRTQTQLGPPEEAIVHLGQAFPGGNGEGKNIVELSTDIGGGAPKTSPVRRSGWAQEVGLEGEWPHDKGSQMSVKDLGLSPEDNREPRMGAEQGGWGYTAQLAEPGPVKAHQGVPQAWPGPAAAAAASPGNSLECKFCGCSPGLLNQKPRDFNKPPGDADASQTGELRTHPTPRLLLLTPPQHTVPAGSALR